MIKFMEVWFCSLGKNNKQCTLRIRRESHESPRMHARTHTHNHHHHHHQLADSLFAIHIVMCHSNKMWDWNFHQQTTPRNYRPFPSSTLCAGDTQTCLSTSSPAGRCLLWQQHTSATRHLHWVTKKEKPHLKYICIHYWTYIIKPFVSYSEVKWL